jgi:hypothetical protein
MPCQRYIRLPALHEIITTLSSAGGIICRFKPTLKREQTMPNEDRLTPDAAAAPEALPASPHTDLLPALVARVYAEATPAVRGRLLEHLLRPLSLLSLAAVANGLFAQLTMGDGWVQRKVSLDDANRVDTSDVIALVHHVQQVSVQAVESLSKVIVSSPMLASSAAAAMLLTLLAKQRRNRAPVQGNDFDPIA